MAATARYFKVKPETVHRHLKFWWPGKLYLKEFGEEPRKPKWDRPTAELLKVMNDEASVARAAKALKTTAVTLTKALERHRIVQRWVVEEPREDGKEGATAPRIRPQGTGLS